jgi:hypothetical protein
MHFTVKVVHPASRASYVFETTAATEEAAERNAGVRMAKRLGMIPSKFFGRRKRGKRVVRIADQYVFTVNRTE